MTPKPHWTPEEIAEWDRLLPTFKTGPQSGKGRTVVWDLEGNGLLRQESATKHRMTKLWCVGALDVETREKFYWGWDLGEENLKHALRFISECDLALAHNGIGFDYQVLEELFPGEFKRPAKAWDTMVCSKVIWPADTLIGPDMQRIREGSLPGRLLKSHSLEAWGYRLGTFKVDYSGGFEEWRPAMASYMMSGDLDVPDAMWTLIKKRLGWTDPEKAPLVWPELVLEVEHEVARIIKRQELDGVTFDMESAVELSKELLNEQKRIETRLIEVFGSWWQPLDDPKAGTTAARTTRTILGQYPDVTLPRVSEKTGKELKPYVGPPLLELCEGDAFVRIERTTFNPGSRDHLGMRLQAVFGWKPKAFGKDGKPTVDESTLSEIPDAVMPADIRQLILDYFVVTKTYGMLSKGAKAWIALCNKHGEKHGSVNRIHGAMDTIGAVTRRGIHKDPNLSQVPSVKKEKVTREDGSKVEQVVKGLKGRYGYECRSLFTADPGWEQTGCDASSLELIDLGHYLWPMDDGAFSARVCDPKRDPHQEHADLAGMLRADAKTAIYLKVYGGSAYKLSLDIDIEDHEIPEYLGYRGLPMLLKSLEQRFDADFVRKLDDRQKAKIAKARTIILKLEAGIEGLKDLIESVQGAAQRGWLKAIDKSRIHVRKPHAALNSLLQSAGAISCKLWIMLVHRELERRGLAWGKDYRQVLWVHDELQFTHRPGLGPVIKEVCEEMLVRAGEMLGLRGRYRTDGKTGKHWADTH
jgi:DNA polymerase I